MTFLCTLHAQILMILPPSVSAVDERVTTKPNAVRLSTTEDIDNVKLQQKQLSSNLGSTECNYY